MPKELEFSTAQKAYVPVAHGSPPLRRDAKLLCFEDPCARHHKGNTTKKNKKNERPRPEKCKQTNIATMKGFVFRGGTLTNSKYNCTQIRRLELVIVPNMTQMFTSSGPWASPAAAGQGP